LPFYVLLPALLQALLPPVLLPPALPSPALPQCRWVFCCRLCSLLLCLCFFLLYTLQ
jgi:hypothetical protein